MSPCLWFSASDVSSFHILQSLVAFRIALEHNPQSSEVSRKIKKLTQLARDKKRVQEVENKRSNVDMAKHLETLKSELVSVVLLLSVMISFYLVVLLVQFVNICEVIFADPIYPVRSFPSCTKILSNVYVVVKYVCSGWSILFLSPIALILSQILCFTIFPCILIS